MLKSDIILKEHKKYVKVANLNKKINLEIGEQNIEEMQDFSISWITHSQIWAMIKQIKDNVRTNNNSNHYKTQNSKQESTYLIATRWNKKLHHIMLNARAKEMSLLRFRFQNQVFIPYASLIDEKEEFILIHASSQIEFANIDQDSHNN